MLGPGAVGQPELARFIQLSPADARASIGDKLDALRGDALRGRLAPPSIYAELPLPDAVPARLTSHAGDSLPSPADVELVAAG